MLGWFLVDGAELGVAGCELPTSRNLVALTASGVAAAYGTLRYYNTE